MAPETPSAEPWDFPAPQELVEPPDFSLGYGSPQPPAASFPPFVTPTPAEAFPQAVPPALVAFDAGAAPAHFPPPGAVAPPSALADFAPDVLSPPRAPVASSAPPADSAAVVPSAPPADPRRRSARAVRASCRCRSRRAGRHLRHRRDPRNCRRSRTHSPRCSPPSRTNRCRRTRHAGLAPLKRRRTAPARRLPRWPPVAPRRATRRWARPHLLVSPSRLRPDRRSGRRGGGRCRCHHRTQRKDPHCRCARATG